MVNERPAETLPASFFDEIYGVTPDPWSFATSEYEAAKYAQTLAALPRGRYDSALEIGCSIGVLTEQLAGRCDRLLSLDIAERALQQARERCARLPQVQCELRQIPEDFPAADFDLILVSEVGYYWSAPDLVRSRDLILEHLMPRGHLLLVHWTVEVPEYPLNGDDVHAAFFARVGDGLRHLSGRREDTYRMDLFERSARNGQ
jgi:predicted TPR repeat methyltransferase